MLDEGRIATSWRAAGSATISRLTAPAHRAAFPARTRRPHPNHVHPGLRGPLRTGRPRARRAARPHRHAPGRRTRSNFRAWCPAPAAGRIAGCSTLPIGSSTLCAATARAERRFERVSWESALDEVAHRLSERAAATELTPSCTPPARARFAAGFSGAAASTRFFSHLGPGDGTSGNMSFHSADVAAHWMLGGRRPRQRPGHAARLAPDPPVGKRTRPRRGWGPTRPTSSPQRRERGARVVLIDPRYTDSGILADQWMPIRPGTDAALVAAMAYVLETEGLVDRAFMASHTVGYERVSALRVGHARAQRRARRTASPRHPSGPSRSRASRRRTSAELARAYGTIKPAALLPGWGPQRSACTASRSPAR